jgi:hypothetical protein
MWSYEQIAYFIAIIILYSLAFFVMIVLFYKLGYNEALEKLVANAKLLEEKGYKVNIKKSESSPKKSDGKKKKVKKEVKNMAYEHGAYKLYSKQVKLKNGRNQTIYFFAKKTPKSGTPADLPSGFAVKVNQRTTLPYLKRK